MRNFGSAVLLFFRGSAPSLFCWKQSAELATPPNLVLFCNCSKTNFFDYAPGTIESRGWQYCYFRRRFLRP